MFKRWRQERKELELAHALYCALVEQARAEQFYTHFGVEDSLEGRLDLILLHMFFVLHTLRLDAPKSDGIAQKLQETMIRDIDSSLREIGVGDMNVGKQMRHVGASLLGRLKVYGDAVEGDIDRDALKQAVIRNIFRESETGSVDRFVSYIEEALGTDMVRENQAGYKGGTLKFPDLANMRG